MIAAVKLRVRAVDATEFLHVCSDKVEALDAAIVVVAEDKLTAGAHDVVAQGLEPQEWIWRFLLDLVAKASYMLPKPFFLPTDAGYMLSMTRYKHGGAMFVFAIIFRYSCCSGVKFFMMTV